MARASRKEAEQHRKDIVESASRLFREKGVGRVSVPELMAAAGLTHGGFYGHFASKDALAGEAFSVAFQEMAGRIGEAGDVEAEAGRQALIDLYLSPEHRDHPEAGCPAAALVDFARDTDSDAVRSAYAEGVGRMLERMARLEGGGEAGHTAALATLSTLVGALVLSRATAGTPLSDAFLEAAKAELGTPPRDGHP